MAVFDGDKLPCDQASTTHRQIETVDLATVPIMTKDRGIPRKEQAKLARELFRQLRIKGLSVTTPRYSMATCVHVGVPLEFSPPSDYVLNNVNYEASSYSDIPAELPVRRKMDARGMATKKVKAILAAAFPNHDDRSDYLCGVPFYAE